MMMPSHKLRNLFLCWGIVSRWCHQENYFSSSNSKHNQFKFSWKTLRSKDLNINNVNRDMPARRTPIIGLVGENRRKTFVV